MLKQNFTAFYTIFRKEVTRFLRIWTQTLLPPIITQSLYFLIFGNFIGSRINDGDGSFVNGISFIQFVIPGLVMMSVINASFSNVVSSFFGSKFQRSYEELQVSPTPHWVIVAGYSLAGVLRGLIVGVIVFIVSYLFASPGIYNIFVIFLYVMLTAIVFALGGLINGIFAKKFDDVGIFTTFILTPLTYLGGVFYSIESLREVSPFWYTVSRFNPVVYMIDGFRYGFYGFNDFPLWQSSGILLFFFALLSGLSLYLLGKGYGMKS
jgi:ABC-2 type transport system permease protein